MAINASWDFNPYNPNDSSFEFKHQDIAIGGKLVRCMSEFTAQKILSFGSEAAFNDYVKSTISNDMAKYMLANRLIEFTRMQDPRTLSTMINARCYLAPDDQIKILRTYYNV